MFRATIRLNIRSAEGHNFLVQASGDGTTQDGALTAASHNVHEKSLKVRGKIRVEGFCGPWTSCFEGFPEVVEVAS